MEHIKHIVYLMLENRSFDSVLGWLYENDTPNHIIPEPKSGSETKFNGLQTGRYYNPDGNGGKVPVSKIHPRAGQTIPSVDPHEEFQHVQVQIANDMNGFYIDFADCGSRNSAEIMSCYTPQSLPVLNSLAKQFAVSDAYFSSIPTQTNCNRAFSLTGNSIGSYHDYPSRTAMVDNYWQIQIPPTPYEFTETTIWNVLTNNGFETTNDWMIFYSQNWMGAIGTGPDGVPIDLNSNYCFTQDLFWPQLQNSEANFAPIEIFYDKLFKGELPIFSYLEPLWFENGTKDDVTISGHNGNSYHPPADVCPGENFLEDLFYKLQASPEWINTLLIINFDEHGGTYDHVTPPSGVMAPWTNSKDGTTPPDDYDPVINNNFLFTQLGVRVPLILVSPLINEKTVFRSTTTVPFDHTSVMATILNHFKIDKSKWNLGSRTANAPTFENVITISPENARFNVMINSPINTECSPFEDIASDLHRMITHRYLIRLAETINYSKEKTNKLLEQHFNGVKTIRQLNEVRDTIIHQMQIELKKDRRDD